MRSSMRLYIAGRPLGRSSSASQISLHVYFCDSSCIAKPTHRYVPSARWRRAVCTDARKSSLKPSILDGSSTRAHTNSSMSPTTCSSLSASSLALVVQPRKPGRSRLSIVSLNGAWSTITFYRQVDQLVWATAPSACYPRTRQAC